MSEERETPSSQTPPAMAERIPAEVLYNALLDVGVTDVVAVPDTHVRTLIDVLVSSDRIRFIQTATEDEAIMVAAGLIIGGRKPLVQIQHAGLFACANHVNGVARDGEFPMVFMVGLLGRDPEKAPRENFSSLVSRTEPLLDALGVPAYLLDRTADVRLVEVAYREAAERQGPAVLLIGDATS